jgi:hypothetical protein
VPGLDAIALVFNPPIVIKFTGFVENGLCGKHEICNQGKSDLNAEQKILL